MGRWTQARWSPSGFSPPSSSCPWSSPSSWSAIARCRSWSWLFDHDSPPGHLSSKFAKDFPLIDKSTDSRSSRWRRVFGESFDPSCSIVLMRMRNQLILKAVLCPANFKLNQISAFCVCVFRFLGDCVGAFSRNYGGVFTQWAKWSYDQVKTVQMMLLWRQLQCIFNLYRAKRVALMWLRTVTSVVNKCTPLLDRTSFQQRSTSSSALHQPAPSNAFGLEEAASLSLLEPQSYRPIGGQFIQIYLSSLPSKIRGFNILGIR